MKKSPQHFGHFFSKNSNSLILLIAGLLFFSTPTFAQLVTYTFTNASATGSAGPSQAQINSAYLTTNLNGSVTVTGGIQSFTVPASGAYRIEARGAQGAGSQGGLGASMAGDFTLTAGQVLKILVGQVGQSFNSDVNIGGGGGSYVVSITNTILVIAGGGGAARAVYPEPCGTISINGQSGNFTGATVQGAGGIAGAGGGGASCRGGGGAGWFSNGGIGGCGAPAGQGGITFLSGGFGGGLAGSGAVGGFGGGGSSEGSNLAWTYAGGGGGYSGGGGASEANTSARAGGGGSINNGANQINTACVNSGDGRVIITKLCNLTIGSNSGSNVICSGSALTLTTNAISNYSWSTGSSAASIVVSPVVNTSYTLTAMSPQNCMTSAVLTVTVSNSAPVLTVSSTANTVCLNNTVAITASGAITYTWSGGITNGVTFTPTITSNYTVQGQNGCGTTTAAITVSVLPLPVFGISSPTLVCAGNTATLSAGGATSYTWQPGNIVGTNVLVSPQVNTTYTVLGVSGTCAGINTVNLLANPIPTIGTSASASLICLGTTVTLTATGGLSYTWQPGNVTGASIVVTPTAPTAYIATGVNSFNCSASASQPVVTYASPTVTAISSNTVICLGGSATLTAAGADAYSWNTGATTSVTVVNPISSTVYTVTGTNTTTSCFNTQTVSVSVFVATIAVTSPTAICLGSTVNLVASGATSYTWSTGSNNNSISVSPVVTTTYTVNGVSTVGTASCSSSGVTTVTVNPLPVVTAVSTRTNICKGESTNLTAGGASTYLWNTSATTSVIAVNPLITTNYTVNGTSSANCAGSATIQVKVFNCTGIDEVSSSQNGSVLIYPNPSSGDFSIQANEQMDLNLINELGQVVRTLNLNAENNYQATVKDLANGVYFVVSQNNQYQVNQKVVIQK